MGNPNTGEIYEGGLRDEGDVALDREQAEWLKSLPLRNRIDELKRLSAAEAQTSNVEMVSEPPRDPLAELREMLKEPTTPLIVNADGMTREMPRYKSHKEVWALKIANIVRDGEGENRETDGSATLTPAEEGYAPIRVTYDYLRKHNPQVGGYYVVYKDGYQSYSPAQAFEEGYTRL
jgi:hypothetical protein